MNSLDEGWRLVLDEPLSRERVRCFVTDSLTATHAIRDSNGKLATLCLSPDRARGLGFGISFAALRSEEGLIDIIDQAVGVLRRNTVFLREVYGRHADILRDADALTECGYNLRLLEAEIDPESGN